ncbi:MAG: SIMPL domain-containing protein [Clostridia bacterium]|nr:SIMPL domain-containing protein [Clostridia bacterium]
MKKSIIFFSFLLSFIFVFTLFSTNTLSTEKASAQSLKTTPQSIIIVGSGEVEVAPDTVQINFGLKSRADDLLTGQTKMKENIDSITKKIQEVDKDAVVNISFSSSYPINHGGIFGYEVDCCLTAKSSKVESVTDLTEAIISSNITSVHNTNYILTNKEDAYIQALVKAKENADSKAKAMFATANFKGLKEESYYNFCESSKGDKIKVYAKVKAFYEITNSEDTNTVQSTNAFEINQNKTPVNSNKTEQELLNENTKEITQKENQQQSINKKENNFNLNNNQETSVLSNQNNRIIDNKNDNKNLSYESQTTSSKVEENALAENIKNNKENNIQNTEQNSTQTSNNIVNAPKGSIIDANGNITKIEDKNVENNTTKNNLTSNQEEGQIGDISNKKSA